MDSFASISLKKHFVLHCPEGGKKIGKDVFGLAGMTVWLLVFVTWSVIYNVECDKKLCCQCERTRCLYLLSLSFN